MLAGCDGTRRLCSVVFVMAPSDAFLLAGVVIALMFRSGPLQDPLDTLVRCGHVVEQGTFDIMLLSYRFFFLISK